MGVRLSSGGPIIWSIQLVKSSGGRFHHLTFLDPYRQLENDLKDLMNINYLRRPSVIEVVQRNAIVIHPGCSCTSTCIYNFKLPKD